MRRIYFNLFSVGMILLTISSCKKDVLKAGEGTAALTIINGVTDNDKLYTNFNGTALKGVRFYGQLAQVLFSFPRRWTSYSGQQKLALYRSADTLQGGKPLFNLALNLPVNTMHTLFLMGTTQSPDTLFITNSIPYHLPADSTMGIRFVNISQGGNPISVNLVGQPKGSAIANLFYKSATAFKTYSARSTINSYTFEFWDTVTGELVASHKLDGINMVSSSQSGPNRWLDNNFTLTLLGAPGKKKVILAFENYRP